jgi:hypothetical protein
LPWRKAHFLNGQEAVVMENETMNQRVPPRNEPFYRTMAVAPGMRNQRSIKLTGAQTARLAFSVFRY